VFWCCYACHVVHVNKFEVRLFWWSEGSEIEPLSCLGVGVIVCDLVIMLGLRMFATVSVSLSVFSYFCVQM
jgi:hypothetical protein